MQLLQLRLVFSLHATQHVPDNHHEGVKLKRGISDRIRLAEHYLYYLNLCVCVCLAVEYLVEVEVVVYTKRDQVRQNLGGEVFFGDAQLLMGEGALIDS